MKRILAILLFLSLLVGCTASPAKLPQGARSFTDDAGRTVSIAESIMRVVPSGPASQIVLFAIAPDLMVGLASEWDKRADGIIAEEYQKLPYFGQIYSSADLNVEELAAVAPQLIIDIGQAKDSIVEDLDTLTAQTGIPAVHIAATLESMPQTYRTLGKLLNREERGEKLAQFCERVYTRTQTIMQSVGENKVDALYITGEEGLNVIAQGSYHAELIDMLTNNVAVLENPSSKGSGNAVDMEQIALWNPELLIFATGSIYASVAGRPAWQELSAIQSGNYIESPEAPYNWLGTPPSVQRYLGLIWLTAVLYPEFCDYDVKAELMEGYRLFYGCELSEEQYAALTQNAFLPQ